MHSTNALGGSRLDEPDVKAASTVTLIGRFFGSRREMVLSGSSRMMLGSSYVDESAQNLSCAASFATIARTPSGLSRLVPSRLFARAFGTSSSPFANRRNFTPGAPPPSVHKTIGTSSRLFAAYAFFICSTLIGAAADDGVSRHYDQHDRRQTREAAASNETQDQRARARESVLRSQRVDGKHSRTSVAALLAVRCIAWLGVGWLVSNRGASFLLQKPFVNIGLVIDIQNKMIPSLQNVETRVSAGRLDRLN